MRIPLTLSLVVLTTIANVSHGATPVDAEGRPLIKKLGTVAVDVVETSPIVLQGKLYRCEWFRNATCFRFTDCETGQTTPQFAKGWSFASNEELTSEQRQRIATAKDVNNSDIDFCDYQGHLVIFYSWGDQVGTEHLAEAVYEGTLADFLQGWFPENAGTASTTNP